MTITCKKCRKEVKSYPSKRQLFCSYTCSKIGQRHVGKQKGSPAWNKGLKGFRAGEERPYAQMPKGEENIKWIGNDVGYRALHAWVERQLGKPSKCSCCRKVAYGHGIHWANKSQKYLRDVNDWIRLCARCHVAYDSGRLQITTPIC